MAVSTTDLNRTAELDSIKRWQDLTGLKITEVKRSDRYEIEKYQIEYGNIFYQETIEKGVAYFYYKISFIKESKMYYTFIREDSSNQEIKQMCGEIKIKLQ